MKLVYKSNMCGLKFNKYQLPKDTNKSSQFMITTLDGKSVTIPVYRKTSDKSRIQNDIATCLVTSMKSGNKNPSCVVLENCRYAAICVFDGTLTNVARINKKMSRKRK